jgi:hypothetical protein
MPYEYGQIVLVPVTDGHGNIKPHADVILSPADQIVPGTALRMVCVSSQVETAPLRHNRAGTQEARSLRPR